MKYYPMTKIGQVTRQSLERESPFSFQQFLHRAFATSFAAELCEYVSCSPEHCLPMFISA